MRFSVLRKLKDRPVAHQAMLKDMYIKTASGVEKLKSKQFYYKEYFDIEPINKHTFVTALIEKEVLYVVSVLSSIEKSSMDGNTTFNQGSGNFKCAHYFTETQLKDEGLIADGKLLDDITREKE